MMDSAGWYTAIGVLLVGMALAASLVRRLPITTSIVYLGAGAILGRTGWLDVDPVRNRFVVETLAEAAVLISLFAAGLKVRAPLKDRLWRLPLRMASVGMVITIAIVAVMGRWLGLSWGESVLLAAILAPTDPVLASEVQLAHPHDTDRLRFTLTGEAGLNDGAAFPFVMFGLGALGLHEVGPAFSRWALWDLLWPVAGGLLIGAAFGTVIARLTLFLRRTHKEAVGLDDFLALGLIGLSYGAALNLGAYGFLSVFAAGLALRRVERMEGDVPPTDVRLQGEAADALATDPERAPAYMAQAALGFIEQMERLAEVAVVVMVGAMLPRVPHPRHPHWIRRGPDGRRPAGRDVAGARRHRSIHEPDSPGWMVRHARCRVRLLPCVCVRTRSSGTGRRDRDDADVVDDRSLGGSPWRLRHTAARVV